MYIIAMVTLEPLQTYQGQQCPLKDKRYKLLSLQQLGTMMGSVQ